MELPLIFYIAVIIIFVLLQVYWMCAQTPVIMEGLNEIQGRYCPSCDNLSANKCLDCYNCGFMARGHTGKCMHGEFSGPFNGDEKTLPHSMELEELDKVNNQLINKTERWIHNDTFWRNLFRTANVEDFTSNAYLENRTCKKNKFCADKMRAKPLEPESWTMTCRDNIVANYNPTPEVYIIERNTGTPINVTYYGKNNRDCMFPAFEKKI